MPLKNIPSGRKIIARAKAGGGFESDYDAPANSTLLFAESFDSQVDWDSGLPENISSANPAGLPDRVQTTGTHTLPTGWYACRQDPRWADSLGYAGGHEAIEILSANSDKARSGGKSYVAWRDSDENNGVWTSDNILTWFSADGHDELFVRFYAKFDPNWTANVQSKLFRIFHWDQQGELYKYTSSGFNGPGFFWDHFSGESTPCALLSPRGYPISSNYGLSNPTPINLARPPQYLQDQPIYFTSYIKDLDGDGTDDNVIDTFLDSATGQPVDENSTFTTIWRDQWRKVEFYVKMNSAPGVRDGSLWMLIDDDFIFKNDNMPWAGSAAQTMPKFNTVSFGGNNDFHTYPNADRRQEWWSADDIEIHFALPEDKQ